MIIHAFRLCHPECEGTFPYCTLQLIAQSEADWHEYERDEDLAHEHELTAAHLRGDEDVPWPWYAEELWDVQEPEVFDP